MFINIIGKFPIPPYVVEQPSLSIKKTNNIWISNIVAQLEARFTQDLCDNTERRKLTCDGMSLLDKMGLWGSKMFGDPESKPEDPEPFQGVEIVEDDGDEDDDDDDDADNQMVPLDLPDYSHAILGSAAYKWLLSCLATESTLHWGTGSLNVMVNEVREMILLRLPTGIISRSSPPRTFRVSFKLPRLPFQSTFNRQISAAQNVSRNLFDITVLTCSSNDETQATTVEQYFQQLWPDDGVEFLNSLQNLLYRNTDGYRFSGRIPILVLLLLLYRLYSYSYHR